MWDILPAYLTQPGSAITVCYTCGSCAICAACLGDGPMPDFQGVTVATTVALWGPLVDQ